MSGMTRREFGRVSAMAAAAGCALRFGGGAVAAEAQGASGRTSGGVGSGGLIYGVQMFMLRRQAATDLAGVFRAIHEAGFAQVELYPIAYGHPPAELRRMIQDAGLGAVSGHFDYVGLEEKLDYGHQLGLKYYVCPMLPADQWKSLDGFRKAAELFNRVGKGAQTRGMQFVFHNHDYEFRPIEGSNGWTELMKGTDPKLVKLELDCYWLTQAGQEPMSILKANANRAVLIHMKDRVGGAPTSFDMEKGSEHFTELGKGSIDWPALLGQAKRQGIRYAFLDQDETAGPVPESMKVSREYLRGVKV